ncbi:hypothetical protein A9G42_01420 [Gilliamella sp. Nev6-6]|uniref:hypothetical protein n=1 Tax=Gilliamella sp. Nev6-6 TaxID=3120252 RepID=UPI00080F45FD|nr:hypothetical protein [Gilliamella apicola]OCG73465.1 hypothetical protein A9G42_01420 [Gilliamella apicola]
MKLFNYNSIILATTLSLTGCCFCSDTDTIARDLTYDNVVIYCESNHYAFCEVYAQCFLDVFDQLNVYPSNLYGLINLPFTNSLSRYKKVSAKNFMDNLYSRLKEEEKINREVISLDVSYLLYSHNQCSSIIGVKQYDISHYYPKIEKSIERKRKKMNKK